MCSSDLTVVEMNDDKDGDRPFQGIGHEGQRREILAPGAQNIGRADIARTDRAQIRRPGKPRQDEPERNRAAEIAEEKSKEAGEHVGRPALDPKRFAKLAVPRRPGNWGAVAKASRENQYLRTTLSPM